MVEQTPNLSRILASQLDRARADECRVKAQAFRNSKARTQMLQLAADYDRKAVQAEELEVPANENKLI
jgi:hypothetical protein